jgi:hypothetical protein
MQRFSALLRKSQVLPLSEKAAGWARNLYRTESERPASSRFPSSRHPGTDCRVRPTHTIPGRSRGQLRGHEEHLAKINLKRRADGLDTVLMAGDGVRATGSACSLSAHDTYSEIFRGTCPRASNTGLPAFYHRQRKTSSASNGRSAKKKTQGVHIDLIAISCPASWSSRTAGIGRYDGLVNLEAGGVRRDYLKITYASEDSLYISMENLDQIQKYVGSEGREPKLSRLGGQEWNRMKEKARTSIRKLAVDLVALYAQRRSVKGHKFAPDTVWQKEFEEDRSRERH